MSHAFHFGSDPSSLTDCSGSTYGLNVLDWDVAVMPAARVRSATAGHLSGAWPQCGQMEPHELNVTVQITGDDSDDLRDKLDALKFLLDPRNGEQCIKLDAMNDRFWYVMPVKPALGNVRGARSIKTTLVFNAFDPFAYSTTETNQNGALSGSTNITVPAAGTVAGTEYALPTIECQNTGSTASIFTVENTTTGDKSSADVPTPNNGEVRVRWAQRRQPWMEGQITAFGITWSSSNAYLNSDTNNGIRLQPGVANSLTISGFTTGTYDITYRARYIP